MTWRMRSITSSQGGARGRASGDRRHGSPASASVALTALPTATWSRSSVSRLRETEPERIRAWRSIDVRTPSVSFSSITSQAEEARRSSSATTAVRNLRFRRASSSAGSTTAAGGAAGVRTSTGQVLDVGCGAGRHSLEAQRRGCEVLAIDISPGAVEVARRRGVVDVRLLPLAGVDSTLGVFDTVLMMCGNFGLFGTEAEARRLLRTLHEISSPEARIVFDSVDPSDDPHDLKYQARNRSLGRRPGQVTIRLRYRDVTTPWYELLNLSPGELQELLEGTGWRVAELVPSTPPEYFGILEKAVSHKALTSALDDIPAIRQLWARPARIRPPLLPARRPGPRGDHALTLRSDCARFLLAEAAAGQRRREVILVLPAPRSVRLHRDVERMVAGIPPERRRSQRVLKVHVPVCELTVAPEQPQ